MDINHETMGLGHNSQNMDPFEALEVRFNELLAASGAWDKDGAEITTQEQADKASGFVKQVAACARDMDNLRKDTNAPHQKIITDNNKRFKPYAQRLDDISKAMKQRIGDYLRREERRKLEEQRRAEEEAKRAEAEALAKQKAAEDAQRKAEEADGSGAQAARASFDAQNAQARAEAAREDAKAKASKKVAAGKGQVAGGVKRSIGLRTFVRYEVTDAQAALADLIKSGARLDDLHVEIGRLAAIIEKADGRIINGVQRIEERRAV